MELIERAFTLTGLSFTIQKSAVTKSKEFHQNRIQNADAIVSHYSKHLEMYLRNATLALDENPTSIVVGNKWHLD